MGAKLPRVETVFGEAMEIATPAERSAYLDRACGGDAVLRRQVESLLDAHIRAGDFLESPASTPTITLATKPAVEGPGTTIGPYRLLEEIGEGGMGVVYMAEQTAPVRRRVALKVIRPGMDSRQVVARFEAERQALALMDHPNIAKVHDAGAAESGRPFFVMELVRGLPITDYCDREGLSVAERLELFVLVCRAVQHAHQKGVIHRDLKPSNVLVTVIDGVPTPKVIDFGVAKATGGSLTDRSLFTGFHQMIGTPLYMSPEQADLSSADVDTRSDIYALGVLLYELLTGSTPFDRETFQKAAFDEMRRIIREDEPPKPSTRLSTMGETLSTVSARRGSDPRRLDRTVRGELDWIAMKALEKDRRRRYETANDFAADVMRYLTDRPVEACPPSARYRFSKYARRNRAALTTAALVGMALVAGLTLSTWQAFRATRAEGLAEKRFEAERTALAEVSKERNLADLARQDADRRAVEAQEVVDFLINDMIGAASPTRALGKIPTVVEVLARADERVAQKFADRPLIEASIRHALGQAYEEMGQFKKAEGHAARAVELRLARLGPEHVETIASQNTLGWDLTRQGKMKEAQALMATTYKTARKALGPERPETLQAMHVLAVTYSGAEARAFHEELLALKRRVLGTEDPKTLATMNNLASLLLEKEFRELESAKRLLEEVVAVQRRERPDHPQTLLTMQNLAQVYASLRQYDSCYEMRREVLQGRDRVLGLTHPFIQDSIGLYTDVARRIPARWEEARRILEAMRDRSLRDLGKASGTSRVLTSQLAIIVGLIGRTDQAATLMDQLPEDRESLQERDELVRSLYLFGRQDAALVQLRRLEALRPRLVPPDDVFGLTIRSRLALVLREQGRFAEAKPLLEQTMSEAIRLRSTAAGLDFQSRIWLGVARFLLDRWPGTAPGTGPAGPPPPSLALESPFRDASPVADGRIDPDEYGPGLDVTFDGDINPGRMFMASPKAADDLSVRLYTAHTDRSVFLAFRVRDQIVEVPEVKAGVPHLNDSIDVFINGDRVANDLTPVFWADRGGSREGFQLESDAAGHKYTAAVDFTNADWKVGTSRTADGYIVEFEIPLALIDTKDGPEYIPATSGSEFLINVGFGDSDTQNSDQRIYGILWAEDPDVSPFLGGEDFWTVGLRLVPRLNAKPAPSANP
jgi:serine/threonine protein kinase/tetratricopeptide (TPR) repeat protein